MAAIVAFQVKPVPHIPELGQRRGQVLPMQSQALSDEDKAVLQTALDTFIIGSAYMRDQMFFTITRIMQIKGLRGVVLDQAILRYVKPGGLRIEAKQMVDRPYCPDCGNYVYGSQVKILQCNEDTGYYSYGCGCGAIFKRLEGCE